MRALQIYILLTYLHPKNFDIFQELQKDMK